MYPLFSHLPASIVELGCFRGGKALIFKCFPVGFSRRLTIWTGGFWIATLGFELLFLKGWDHETDSITKHAGTARQRVMDAGMHGG